MTDKAVSAIRATEIVKLRELAEKATPGPWRISGFEIWAGGKSRVVMGGDDFSLAHVGERSLEENEADATYIAAVSPDVVLAFLKRIEALEAALEQICAQNQIREFMGDDRNDGYGDQGWVTRDGQYAKIARAALTQGGHDE